MLNSLVDLGVLTGWARDILEIFDRRKLFDVICFANPLKTGLIPRANPQVYSEETSLQRVCSK